MVKIQKYTPIIWALGLCLIPFYLSWSSQIVTYSVWGRSFLPNSFFFASCMSSPPLWECSHWDSVAAAKAQVVPSSSGCTMGIGEDAGQRYNLSKWIIISLINCGRHCYFCRYAFTFYCSSHKDSASAFKMRKIELRLVTWFAQDHIINLKLKVKVAQSCLTLCDPMDYIVHGILRARILEWVAFPLARGSS